MKERLHYIDVMKGITMLVVVLHHVLWITVDLKNVTNSTMLFLHGWQDMLASFIMPAFFFCTGYCSSFNKAFKPFFISNFKYSLFAASDKKMNNPTRALLSATYISFLSSKELISVKKMIEFSNPLKE